MEQNRSLREIVGQGYDRADVRRVVAPDPQISEYKRRQAPPGVRITLRGFGKDWRYPITSRLPRRRRAVAIMEAASGEDQA